MSAGNVGNGSGRQIVNACLGIRKEVEEKKWTSKLELRVLELLDRIQANVEEARGLCKDLQGQIVTIDAMGCQRDIAEQI